HYKSDSFQRTSTILTPACWNLTFLLPPLSTSHLFIKIFTPFITIFTPKLREPVLLTSSPLQLLIF
ncbi:hypothetical protein, partial [[Ruminococcus] torques]|uniref:hypothetical protein n=1 Tax=[Ruminococcus] torques TaxID=33039 RepID=UPI003AF0C117